MILEGRQGVKPAEKVWLDGKDPLAAQGRQIMYPLPLKGKFGRADDMALDVNSKVLTHCPGGSGSAAGNGVVILVSMVCWSMVSYGIYLSIESYLNKGNYLFYIVVVSIFHISIFGSFGVALVRRLKKVPVANPLLINRLTGELIQMQGSRRVEAQWNDLRPYIEPVTTISTARASTSCNLHLVHPSEDGKRAWKYIMVHSALGLYDCLSTYEFIARYMEADWEGLPDIYLLPGERPGFWDAYRYGFFNPWIGVPHWEERSLNSRRWM